MRYCNQCNRITVADPLYCNYCGRSYDLKLCPRRHVDLRTAEVCSECGSRDLSTPAPRPGLGPSLLFRALSILPGVVLLGLSVLLLIGFVNVLLTNQQVQFQLLILLLLTGLLWFIYTQFPAFIRKGLKAIWRRSRKARRDRTRR